MANVLYEIGVEELPARFIDNAEMQLKNKTKQWLDELRISYHELVTFSTPRRLAVLIKDIAPEQTTVEEEVKGPSLKIAKDEDGNWTKAAVGFTKGQGKTTDDIYTKEIKGVSYIFLKKRIEGKRTIELLPEFKGIITSIQFNQNMRWGSESIRYARPIRWIVALYDEQVIPLTVSGVESSNVTYGHRFLGDKISLVNPSLYEEQLLKEFVVVQSKKRQQMILEGIRVLEEKENFKIAVDEELLEEVRNLVEYPTVFCGNFASDFLQLPSEVLITSMREHQRYFPVTSKDNQLLPYFIGVRNGDAYRLENVVKGNEKVLRARLTDAQFFYQEDQNESISFYLEKLKRVVFQDKLGTIADKVDRIVKISKVIANELKLDDTTRSQAIRAAQISKFDLMTNMVNEFTELQGIMGEKYAAYFGEDPLVAQAIREHYLPVHANDNLPQTVVGSLVSIADKLDTIIGCFAAGIIPSSSQDPYGLRRQGRGILKILKEQKWNITLDSLITLVQNVYEQSPVVPRVKEEINNQLDAFFNQRLLNLFKDSGLEQDVVQAVSKNKIGQLSYAFEKATVLSAKRNDSSFKPIEEALVRVINLAKNTNDNGQINEELFETESERLLFNKLEEVQPAFTKANEEHDAKGALNYLAELCDPINSFFDHNMVMANEEAIKKNRIALITQLSNLIQQYADLSVIEWKQHF
ncbi:glycine--tRNA ligase subunit beta [Virgibacillus sp. W0430]|uniref:glycine--tRNA ligase subunit beta n=1 Tax=Virgibacillus sp. W0430 TaxID=3391580 RepID=UPI003F465E14